MSEKFEKLYGLIQTYPKRMITLAGIALVMVALPLTLVASQQQQDLRQHAAGNTTNQAIIAAPNQTGSLGVQTSTDTSACPAQLPVSASQAIQSQTTNTSGTFPVDLSVGLTGFDTTNPSAIKSNVRSFLVQFLDQNNNVVDSQNVNMMFDPSTKKFKGQVNVNSKDQKVAGLKAALRTGGYLKNTTLNPVPLVAGTANNVSVSDLLPGDITGSGDSLPNILDYNALINCSVYSRNGSSACKDSTGNSLKTSADLNGDGVVNEDDYNIWLRSFQGVTAGAGSSSTNTIASTNVQTNCSTQGTQNLANVTGLGSSSPTTDQSSKDEPLPSGLTQFNTTYSQSDFASGVAFGGLQGHNCTKGNCQYVGNAPCTFAPAPVNQFQTAIDLCSGNENNACDVQYVANNYTRGDTALAKQGIHNCQRGQAIAGSITIDPTTGQRTVSKDVAAKYPEITNTSFALPQGAYNSVGNLDALATGNTTIVAKDSVLANKPSSVPSNATYGYVNGQVVWWTPTGQYYDSTGKSLTSIDAVPKTAPASSSAPVQSTAPVAPVTQQVNKPVTQVPTTAPTPKPAAPSCGTLGVQHCSGSGFTECEGSGIKSFACQTGYTCKQVSSTNVSCVKS